MRQLNTYLHQVSEHSINIISVKKIQIKSKYYGNRIKSKESITFSRSILSFLCFSLSSLSLVAALLGRGPAFPTP